MNSKTKYTLISIIILFMVTIPNLLPPYYKDLLVEVLIFGLFSLGFDIIFGFAGLLNFGTSVFFGLGGYTVLLSVVHWHVGIWVALILTIMVSAFFSFIYGLLVTRFKSHYFVAFTIVVSMIFFYLAMANSSITGADEGLTFNVPNLNFGFFTLHFKNIFVKYYFVLAFCGLIFFLIWKFFQTPYGKAIIAIKENENRAKMIGYNTRTIKLVAFTISGVVSCMGGALYVLHLGFISAHSFFWLWTARSVWWTIIGGVGTLIGAFVGPAVLVFIEDVLSSWSTSFYLIIMGVIMILVIMLAPEGIIGSIRKVIIKKEK